ncbi:MAG TPA: CoA transferase, partial [Ktedonobacteraceae bacterium]
LPFHMTVGPGEREEAMEILRAFFKTRTRDEWVAELGEIDACVGPVYSIDEALNDQHAQARGETVASGKGGERFHTLRSFPRISSVEDEQRYAPPQIGEQTEELLREAGYSDAEIAQFKTGGVI